MTKVEDQTIYRFMDLFELYELIVNKKLKFTKLRLMPDQNEGLGEILKRQASAWGFQLRNERARLIDAHKEFREYFYLSCWTGTPDAMAMWLLYSTSHSAFRVKTTHRKLSDVMDVGYTDTYVEHHLLKPGTVVPILPRLGSVEYIDFNHIHRMSQTCLKAFDLKVRAALSKKESGSVELEDLLSDEDSALIAELKRGYFLKDIAYRHENEVRASFQLRIRNEMSVEEVRLLPNTFPNGLTSPMLDVATSDNSPEVFSLSVTNDFVEEICFDSRMPDYKKATIRQMLGRDDIPFAITNVFGYLMDTVDLTIPEDH